MTHTPSSRADAMLAADARLADPAIWITRLPDAAIRARAAAVEAAGSEGRPLWGLTVAVKDNIDLAGVPTTAGCPDYAYVPEQSAVAVRRLVDAGAVIVGKANLDQFATGLVGVRSPYGVPRNVFSPAHVPGGSSSGSAVAVAAGIVDVALGTDTAGSGRVPAAFGNIVGLKPTIGSVPAMGMVPACRSVDTISVFARSVDAALAVQRVIAGYEAGDPYSRLAPAGYLRRGALPDGVRVACAEVDAMCTPEVPRLYRRAAGLRADAGAVIAGEIWALPTAAIGALLAQVPAPLGFGTAMLESGPCLGFLAEAHGVASAPDITAHGGWRAWLAAREAVGGAALPTTSWIRSWRRRQWRWGWWSSRLGGARCEPTWR